MNVPFALFRVRLLAADSPTVNSIPWIIGGVVVILVIAFFAFLLYSSRQRRLLGMRKMGDGSASDPLIPTTGAELNDSKPLPPAPVVNTGHISSPVAENVGNDDLTRIPGIGPALQPILYAAGINTYEQLSKIDPAQLKTMLMEKGLLSVDPTLWAQQARMAKEGQFVNAVDNQPTTGARIY